MKLIQSILFLGAAFFTPLQAGTVAKMDVEKDSLYFGSKKDLMTASWEKPFSWNEIRSNHAPLGPYMGNGDVGVVAFTSDNSQTLKISKVDFVTDGFSNWAGHGPSALPVGGVTLTVNSPVHAGNYSLNRPDKTVFRYEMDYLDAELRMKTPTDQPVVMKSWMGMDENFVVTELSTTSKKPVSVSVDTYADSRFEHYATTATVMGSIAQVSRQTKTAKARWVCSAGISTKIVGTEARLERISDAMVRADFKVSAANPVWVVTYVSGGGKGDKSKLKEAADRLTTVDGADVNRIKADKVAWWKDMWTRSYVETHDSLLNRQYLTSIYLLASAYNRHSPVSGGMYGVWNMDDEMMYHGDIHLNYNSQGGFYSAFSANRPEIALPFYKSLELLIPEGKRRAQEELGKVHKSLEGKSCRGILFPVGALGIGEFYNYYWQQTLDAPFNVPLFSWYYEYTGDKEFLRDHAYPYIRLCGDFYEDYLVKESYGDSYRYTITTGLHESSWDLNPPADLALVEQTFSLLLKYSDLLNVDKSRRKKWNDILTHLPTYKVIQPTKVPNEGLPIYAKNEAGWDLPNHVIQMHPVYPCEVLNLRSDSTALQIARNTLYYYEVSQKGFMENACALGLSAYVMWARLGMNPNILIESLKKQIEGVGRNFLIVDGHHCAEKAAVVETINSMMLQSVDDILYLFPCWLDQPASFTRLRTKGAFLVSADYDGSSVANLKIESEKGGKCQLYAPTLGNQITVVSNGKPIQVKKKGDVFSFNTQVGGVYEVR